MFNINDFFIDRIWIKSYPWFFKCIRSSIECFEEFKKFRKEFDIWTSRCFRIYRTLWVLKRIVKEFGLNGIEKIIRGELRPEDFRRYGVHEYAEVDYVNSRDNWLGKLVPGTQYVCNVDGLNVTLDMIIGVKIIEWTTEYGVEKWIYIPIKDDVIRLLVRPYYGKFRPHMIRLLINATRYALYRLEFEGKLNKEYYERSEYVHGNWFIPEVCRDPAAFYFYNRMILQYDWSRILKILWRWLFGFEDIVWKVSVIEITFDGFFDKLKLLDVIRLLPGKSKTFKYGNSIRDEITWSSDEVAKYYITIKRGLQVKTYSKVRLFDGRIVNRIEITLSTKLLQNSNGRITWNQVCDFVDNVIREVNRLISICDDSFRNEVLKLVDQLIPGNVGNKELYREFLLTILIFGSIPGSKRFSDIARHLKKKGIIEVIGRGRYSIYRLKPEYMIIHDKVRQLFQKLGFKIKLKV